MPGSTLARRGATGGYVIAYAVTLASFIVIWFNHPILLYIGRDANLSLWLSKAYADWAYPLDVTAMNPLQGMTSMLMPINPYFNPGTWIFQTALPEVPSRVVSFLVYFLEVTASALLLGVALGFSRLFAFVGALWLAFLLFPPFNFVYGLQGWLATNPPYGHTLALSNLILVAFIRIGAESPAAPGFGRRLARNWLLASCIVLLLLLIVLAAPFYNGGMLVGTFLLTGVIFLSSQSFSQMLWRLAAGVYVLACCAALGFPGFFAGAQASKPLLFYLSNVLNAPADAHDLTLGLPRLANIDILRAMGVRFIITDLQLRANRARMTQVLRLSGGIASIFTSCPIPTSRGFRP